MGMRVGRWYVVTSFWAVRVLGCYPLILPFRRLLSMNILGCFRTIRMFGLDFLKPFRQVNAHGIRTSYGRNIGGDGLTFLKKNLEEECQNLK